MDEQHKQIIDLLNSNIHGVDWLKEEPIELKDIVPIVKEHVADKEPVGWLD
jgi:hemerythrin